MTTVIADEQHDTISVIAPSGLGYGEGQISVRRQLESGELQQPSLDAAIDLMLHDDEVFCLVDAEANDDGCGDGRNTTRVYRILDPVSGEIEVYNRSLRRAKLFGGGLVASASMWRAVEGLPVNGQTLAGDRTFLAGELRRLQISHGAHIDTNATADSCGCGAIDLYLPISRNIITYKDQIISTLKVLYADEFDENAKAITDVFDMYSSLDDSYFAGVTGAKTMRHIESEGAVVKELDGTHKEDIVVLNTVEGTTMDQEALRKKLEEKGLSKDIQSFVVDVWRGRMYARLVANLAVEAKSDDWTTAYARAYADFLVRTLAVSATLTKGDQPVILRSR